MKIKNVMMFGALLLCIGCAKEIHQSKKIETPQKAQETQKVEAVQEVQKKEIEKMGNLKSGTYVTFETSMGNIVCKLFEKETPVTVANFIGLAQGTKEWSDPKTGTSMKKPFYDGLIFHRVIPKFMIQGGCPLGQGVGGPGYQFDDEIVPSLKFSKSGLLAMANAGPGTNGSQFFITLAATPWLNGHHTIFGEVVEGDSVVLALGNVDRAPNDKPLVPVVMKKVTIQRVP